jgi:lysozyme
LRPVLDIEKQVKSLSAAQKNARVQALIDETTARFGVSPIIYTSARVYREEKLTVRGDCPLWVAWYQAGDAPRIPTPWGDEWQIWQTGYGSGLAGFAGDVDRNLLHGGDAELQALCVQP